MLSDDEPFDVERPSTADAGDDKVQSHLIYSLSILRSFILLLIMMLF